MAFALQSCKAYGRYIDEPITTRCHQVLELVYTRGATGDTTADIGTFSAGTFWPAATADATYGSVAIAALPVVQKIMAKAEALECWSLKGNNGLLLPAASASTALNYGITDDGTYPAVAINISHTSGQANPTTVKAVFEFLNKVEERAERYGV